MQRTHLRRDKFYTFDIETTTLITGKDEHSNPIRNGIIWSGQFYDGCEYIQTRSLEETITRLKLIEEYNKDESPYKIVIFVHNLSYEFQFIKDFFNFENILCTSTRRIIAAETDQIVFRCSYFLSNQGLDMFLKNENVPKQYQKTNMDYLVERYPWTPLTPEEEEYCANDVIGLHIALEHRIELCHNQDINCLPLTSTGYVRKDCRKAVTSNYKNRYRFLKEALTKDEYIMCNKAFRGGNTHASRFYSGKYLHPKEGLGQQDERSAYPAVLIMFDYPTSFFKMKTFKQKEFDYYLKKHDKYAMLITVAWKNIRLKNPKATPVPYLSISKCNPIAFHTVKGDKGKQKWKHSKEIDNGRVLAAKYINTTITEQDYLIIKKQYVWEEEKITDVRVSKKKPIPKELKEKILSYFYNKTTLKQDEDSPDFDADIAYNYARSKELLNGIYGMHATKICKPEYAFDEEKHEVIEIPKDEEEQLEEYYKSFSSFLSFQVGTWCTSYARAWLEEGIDACFNNKTGQSDLVYVDTDSCKYLNPSYHKSAFDAINKRRQKLAEERGAYVDYEGKRYYLGVFTEEPKAIGFKTWGAKKYIYSYIKKEKDGSSHLDFKTTISGVPKKKGKKAIKKQLIEGKIKNFDDIDKGFVFRSVKTTSCYMDHIGLQEYEVEGRKVYYASNIAMYPASYTLGLTADYEKLLFLMKDIMEVEANYD